VETAGSSKILVPVYQTTCYYTPEEYNLNIHGHENLKIILLTCCLCFGVNNDGRVKLQEFENQSIFFHVQFPWVLKGHEHMNILFLQWAEACRTI
jgi:hypothetical protein